MSIHGCLKYESSFKKSTRNVSQYFLSSFLLLSAEMRLTTELNLSDRHPVHLIILFQNLSSRQWFSSSSSVNIFFFIPK